MTARVNFTEPKFTAAEPFLVCTQAFAGISHFLPRRLGPGTHVQAMTRHLNLEFVGRRLAINRLGLVAACLTGRHPIVHSARLTQALHEELAS